MRARLDYLMRLLKQSLWFVPGLMVLAAIVLATTLVAIDRTAIGQSLTANSALFRIDADNARSTLSTIAGSMITVASLVASLTLVALTLASSQLGPRLLARFMADRVTQVVLGQFLATFVYALLVSRNVGGESGAFVPHFASALALVLAIVNFGLLIYFIHHVADSIQADTVVLRLSRDLCRAIERAFPERGTVAMPIDAAAPAGAERGKEIRAPRSGYIQSIDLEGLAARAGRRDAVVNLERRAGHFVVAGECIGHVALSGDDAEDDHAWITESVVIGGRRTTTQDVEFSAQAIVEIAVRALSPGVNDYNTPVACLDQLAACLTVALGRDPPQRVFLDSEDRIRVRADRVSVEGLFDTAFNEIRQCSVGNVAVTVRLIDVFTQLAPFAADNPPGLRALRQHVGMVTRGAEARIKETDDRQDVARRLRDLRRAMPEAVS